jgi:hypothetical protein
MVTSCISYGFKSEVADEFENIRLHADVKPGQTTRNELSIKLGKPFINNEKWNVAVYRVSTGHDVILGGLIIPVVFETEKIIIYALVAYDIEGVVKDIDWGMYHENEGRTILEASGFRFDSYNVRIHFPHTEILLAPLPDSQRSMHMPSLPGTCSLFVTPQDISGSTSGEYYQVIYVDDEPLVDQAVASPGFFKISLPAGEHELAIKIPMTILHKPQYFRRTFSCKSGNLLYATRHIQMIDSGEFWDWNKFSLQGEVIVSDSPMQIFSDMQQILFYAGKWFD